MKERNITLDYFKILLSILVIMIHLPLLEIGIQSNSWSGNLLYSVGIFLAYGLPKLAVPSFFIINGYLLDFTNREKVVKYVIKMIKLYVVWTLFYLPLLIKVDQADLKSIWLMMGFFHLWYLPALIGAVICIFFIRKYLQNKILLSIIVVLLFAAGYYIQQMKPDYFSYPASIYKYRNFLFMGIPFVLLGNLIRNIDLSKYKKGHIIALLTIALSFIFIESVQYASRYGMPPNIYMSLIVACPILVILVLKYSKIRPAQSDDLGHLSSAIFFIHPIILLLISIPVANIYMFPFVVIASIFLSFAVIQANKTLKIFL